MKTKLKKKVTSSRTVKPAMAKTKKIKKGSPLKHVPQPVITQTATAKNQPHYIPLIVPKKLHRKSASLSPRVKELYAQAGNCYTALADLYVFASGQKTPNKPLIRQRTLEDEHRLMWTTRIYKAQISKAEQELYRLLGVKV